MTAASDFLELEVLDHVLGKGTRDYPSPTGLFIALFTGVTGLETNAPTLEVSTSGTAYTRIPVTFAAASTGAATTSADVTFSAATGGGFGLVTHIAIVDHVSNVTWGSNVNVLFYGALTTSKQIDASDVFKITTGNLTVSLA